MTALRGIVGRDAHQAMHAALGLEVAVGVLAGDLERGVLDPGLVAGLKIEHVDGVAVPLGPARVHAVQHLGPVLRLGAARAGMDRDHGAQPVVFARQQAAQLEFRDALLDAVELARQVGEQRVVAVGLRPARAAPRDCAAPGRARSSPRPSSWRASAARRCGAPPRACPRIRARPCALRASSPRRGGPRRQRYLRRLSSVARACSRRLLRSAAVSMGDSVLLRVGTRVRRAHY